jgi:hypothetical protein
MIRLNRREMRGVEAPENAKKYTVERRRSI